MMDSGRLRSGGQNSRQALNLKEEDTSSAAASLGRACIIRRSAGGWCPSPAEFPSKRDDRERERERSTVDFNKGKDF